jgi:hypothetical protein
MTQASYRETATQAIAAGWSPTQMCDEHGRPLWIVPCRDGLVPLDTFAIAQALPVREAA